MRHFISDTQPLCRGCGRPIAKWTDSYSVVEHRHYRPDGPAEGRAHVERFGSGQRVIDCPIPRSKGDCQRLVNETVVNVQYSKGENDRFVVRFSTWDGQSYQDEFFCTNNCAIALGYAMARKGWRLVARDDGGAA